MVESLQEMSEFVEKTAAGVLFEFESDSKRQQACLNEFLAKQTQLLNTVNNELVKFSALESAQLEDMVHILRSCQLRLLTIKERMRKASAKAAKMKVRSLKIQQMKQKEALDRELQREAQLTREQEMVVKNSFPNSRV